MTSLILAALSITAVHLGPMGPDAPAREPQLAVRGSNVFLAFGAGDTIYTALLPIQERRSPLPSAWRMLPSCPSPAIGALASQFPARPL